MYNAITGFTYGISMSIIVPGIKWWQVGLILAIVITGEALGRGRKVA